MNQGIFFTKLCFSPELIKALNIKIFNNIQYNTSVFRIAWPWLITLKEYRGSMETCCHVRTISTVWYKDSLIKLSLTYLGTSYVNIELFVSLFSLPD